jgi:GNAT superfamily N-acetyltransferase
MRQGKSVGLSVSLAKQANLMDVEVRIAEDEVTRAACWRLRYDVFVREQKSHPPDADHVQGRLRDRLDASSTVIAAIDRATDAVVGTVRTNPVRHGTLSLYPALHQITEIAVAPDVASSLTTYLAVSPNHRRQGVSVQLVKALYAHAIVTGVRFDYLDCPTAMVPYFVRLGYRWQRALEHPWFGPSHLMRLALLDTTHLVRIHSPLCSVLRPELPRPSS